MMSYDGTTAVLIGEIFFPDFLDLWTFYQDTEALVLS